MEVLRAPGGALNLALAPCFWNLLEGETPPLSLRPWFLVYLGVISRNPYVLSSCMSVFPLIKWNLQWNCYILFTLCPDYYIELLLIPNLNVG